MKTFHTLSCGIVAALAVMIAQSNANAQLTWGSSTAVVNSPTGNYTAVSTPPTYQYLATVPLSTTLSAIGTGAPGTSYTITLYLTMTNYSWAYPKMQSPPPYPTLTSISNKNGPHLNGAQVLTDSLGKWQDSLFQNVTITDSQSLKGYHDASEYVYNMYRLTGAVNVNTGDVKTALKDYRVTY